MILDLQWDRVSWPWEYVEEETIQSMVKRIQRKGEKGHSPSTSSHLSKLLLSQKSSTIWDCKQLQWENWTQAFSMEWKSSLIESRVLSSRGQPQLEKLVRFSRGMWRSGAQKWEQSDGSMFRGTWRWGARKWEQSGGNNVDSVRGVAGTCVQER